MTALKELKIGDIAPKLNVVDQDDNTVTLEGFRGKWVVLYFYPKDNTPGCTTEAVEFTQNIEKFDSLNSVVIGISADSVKSHCNFIGKHNLKVTLLSDPDHKVLEPYGVWQKKKNYGKEYSGIVRTTVLIDPEGKVNHIWPNVKVKGHVDSVLELLASKQ